MKEGLRKLRQFIGRPDDPGANAAMGLITPIFNKIEKGNYDPAPASSLNRQRVVKALNAAMEAKFSDVRFVAPGQGLLAHLINSELHHEDGLAVRLRNGFDEELEKNLLTTRSADHWRFRADLWQLLENAIGYDPRLGSCWDRLAQSLYFGLGERVQHRYVAHLRGGIFFAMFSTLAYAAVNNYGEVERRAGLIQLLPQTIFLYEDPEEPGTAVMLAERG